MTKQHSHPCDSLLSTNYKFHLPNHNMAKTYVRWNICCVSECSFVNFRNVSMSEVVLIATWRPILKINQWIMGVWAMPEYSWCSIWVMVFQITGDSTFNSTACFADDNKAYMKIQYYWPFASGTTGGWWIHPTPTPTTTPTSYANWCPISICLFYLI